MSRIALALFGLMMCSTLGAGTPIANQTAARGDEKRTVKRGLSLLNYDYDDFASHKLNNPWFGSWKPVTPSPSEHSVIAAAKQASANVMIAQQHVQVAKENLLRQQRLVVLAQEKLASAKNTVSEYQRTAAIKEAQAAAAIQNSAVVAAAELHRNEYESAKLAAIHRKEAAHAHLPAGGPWNQGPAVGPWSSLLSPKPYIH